MYAFPCLELGDLVQRRPRLLEGLDERRARGLARLARLRVVAAALDQMVYEVREAEELVRGRRLLDATTASTTGHKSNIGLGAPIGILLIN